MLLEKVSILSKVTKSRLETGYFDFQWLILSIHQCWPENVPTVSPSYGYALLHVLFSPCLLLSVRGKLTCRCGTVGLHKNRVMSVCERTSA